MSVDDILLLGRVAFIAAMYLFLLALALLLRRELRARSLTQGERAPGDLLVMEPGETGMEAGERIPLLSTTTVGRDSGNDIVLDESFICPMSPNLLTKIAIAGVHDVTPNMHNGWLYTDTWLQ